MLDFWPLGTRGPHGFDPRVFVGLALLLLILAILGFIVVLPFAVLVASWRRQFRRAASSILAVVALLACSMLVLRSRLFDPWFWYAMANTDRIEAMVAADPLPAGSRYVWLLSQDVSFGLVGTGNHFVSLVYDESDATGLDPSERRRVWHARGMWVTLDGTSAPDGEGTRLYGHFFRVDLFE